MDNKGSVLMQRYEIGRLLGQGAFAKVYYARSLGTGEAVAVKVINKEKVLKSGLTDQIKREISVMRMVKHPNIVQLYEVMATKTKIYFVIEYAKGGELFNKVTKGRLKEDVARKYFQQLINTIDFCHNRGVYHRDLKPENLLLGENETLKVSDFGLSGLAETKHQDGLLHTICGTPAYVAPEVIYRKGYDGSKADIWSCGVILFVLLAGYLPFYDSNLMQLYRKIAKGEFKCPSWIPPEVRKLLVKILDPNPNTRISMEKIRENSWFKRGLNSNSTKTEIESKEMHLDRASTSATYENSGITAENQQMPVRLSNLNAFDIISISAGFDISGLFEERSLRKELIFTSRQPASVIISKFEEIGKRLKLKVCKKGGGLLKFDGLNEGRKGILSIDAKIFEIIPFFYLVEMKKSDGDTMEYHNIVKEGIRPGLQDIIWAWQGERQPQQLQSEPESQQQQPQPQTNEQHEKQI